MSAALDDARRLLETAGRIVFLTGAGISAESGVPTFRGDGGLWRTHRAEDLATPQAFQRDPRLVWEWYAWRRTTVAACAPNPGHLSLARFALARAGSARLITQNVDGLHRMAAEQAAAGADPRPALPLELHGSLFRDLCSGCGTCFEEPAPVDAGAGDTLPRCPLCGALLRPDVVWFGENLDVDTVAEAFDLARAADVCVAVGTSALVHPAASLPLVTLRSGGAVVEVNPDETPLTPHAAAVLRGSAASVLPVLLG